MALSMWNDDFFSRPFDMDLMPSHSHSQHLRPNGHHHSITRDLMPLMATDLTETEKSFSVQVDLPGVNPEDLEISVMEGNCLCMKAERRHSHEEKNARIHSMERSYGKVQRKIYLPKNADMDSCESHFRNGVLTILIPKKHTQDSSRKLTIVSHDVSHQRPLGERSQSQRSQNIQTSGTDHKWEVKAHFKNPNALHYHGFCSFRVPSHFQSKRETEWTLPGGEVICFTIPDGCQVGDMLTIEFDKPQETPEWSSFGHSQTSSGSSQTHTTSHHVPTPSHGNMGAISSADHTWEVKAHFKNPRALHTHGFCTFKVPNNFSTSKETEFTLPGGEVICFMIPSNCQVGDILNIEFDKPKDTVDWSSFGHSQMRSGSQTHTTSDHVPVPAHGNKGAIPSSDHTWEVKAHFKNPRALHFHGFCTYKVPNNFSTSKETEFTLPGGEVICFMIPSNCQVGDILNIEFDKPKDTAELSSFIHHQQTNIISTPSFQQTPMRKEMHSQTVHESALDTSVDLNKTEVKAYFKNPKSLHARGFCSYKIPSDFTTSKETEWTLPGGEVICFMIPKSCKAGDTLTLEFDKKEDTEKPQSVSVLFGNQQSPPQHKLSPPPGLHQTTLMQSALDTSFDLNKTEVKARFKNPNSLHSHGFCSYKIPANFSTSKETEWRLPGGEVICFMIPSGCKAGDTLTLEFDKEMEFDTHKEM